MHDALARKLLNATRIIREFAREIRTKVTSGLRASWLNPDRLILRERNFTTRFAPDLIYAHNQSSIYVIVVTHAMTRDAQARISHGGFCCAIDAETYGVSDLHHMEKVMHGGGR